MQTCAFFFKTLHNTVHISITSFINIYLQKMFKIEVIDRYMHCMMQNLKKMHRLTVCIYSLADLNIGHCVELTFLEGKLGRYLY